MNAKRSRFHFPYDIVATAARIGEVISLEAWAERVRIPHRRESGHVEGALAARILGIEGKSWAPELFRDPDTVARVGAEALERAGIEGRGVDALLVVTCTPYEVRLDQDSFRFLRSLGVPDRVPPLQLAAGGAGLACAARVAATLCAEHVLILSYNLPSCYMVGPTGEINPSHRSNSLRPFKDILWTSPGIFSDVAAALVLRRNPESQGVVFYTRDSPSFDGTSELACHGMHGERVKDHYARGMALNHRLLAELRPGYAEAVRRIYTHQASPALVSDFLTRSELPLHEAPSNTRELGNLVTPCMIKLLDDDIASEQVRDQHEICVSVVGAGPERGFLMSRVEVGWRPARRSA